MRATPVKTKTLYNVTPLDKATDAKLSKMLRNALSLLADADCTFWACNGPSKPEDMITCTHCWGLREIATVLETLKARQRQ
jgi:hypothetical protein